MSVPDLMVTKMEAVRFRRELRDHIDLHAMDTLSGHTLVDGIGCRHHGHDRPPPALDDIIECLADPGHLRDDPALGHLRGGALAHLRVQAAAMNTLVTTLRSLPVTTQREGATLGQQPRPRHTLGHTPASPRRPLRRHRR